MALALSALVVFVLLLGAGVGVGVRAILGRRDSATDAIEILEGRMARGEISPEEYRERLEALGPRPRSGRWLLPLATGLVVVGLVGSLFAAASVGAEQSWGSMRRMMGGMMDGGMSMMGDGADTQREAPPPEDGAEEHEVVAGDFFFEPRRITVRAGEAVNLTLDNQGRLFHTLTVEDVDFELRASPGETISGAFEVGEPGEYTFICDVPGHLEAGMRGTIVVATS